MTNNTNTAAEMDENLRIYEVGFHLIPSLSEEQLGQEMASIKEIVEKAGGSVISEEFPKLRPLAYAIDKVTAGVKRIHDKAYFGNIKFYAPGEGAVSIKETLDTNDKIIRFILIKTEKDTPLFSQKIAYRSKKTGKDEEGVEGKDEVAKAPVSEAEIDKSIDELVAQ